MSNNYTVYHLHTEQSLLDSCTNYKLYVDKAVELGQTAIAFSEHGVSYNWVDKKMYCDKMGIKYIHGVEVYLTKQLEPKIRDNYHTILLAKNHDGVKEINRLIYIASQDDHFYYKPRLSFDEFLNISDNVIKISACLASPLRHIRDNEELLKKYDYYEIQYHNHPEQIEYNKYLLDMSKKHNKPLILGTDTHSIDQYKAECRTIIQYAKKIDFENEDAFDLTYKSYDELCLLMEAQNSIDKSEWIKAIENTNIMAESVEGFELDTSFKYPKLYDNEEEVLWNTIKEKLKYKVDNNIIKKENKDKYTESIKEEMRVFKKIGMIGFILFMSELMSWCRASGIPYGFCRGSVGGSVVCYITDIIDVDPVVWDTVFSRMANEDRIEIGDIDVDISPDQRELVYNYIIERFGVEYTSYILASGTVSDKGAIDEIGRGLDYKWRKDGGTGVSPYNLDVIKEIKSEFEQNPDKTRKKYPEVFYFFDGVINTVVSQSVHPAGIIASPVNLIDEYGCFNSKDKNIICINMEEVHEVSLVKYDILGLLNVQIIRDTCKLVGIDYPLSHEINWNDEFVWNDIITSPVGIFQFESDFAFDSLKKMKPKKINDMSLVNASIRPSGTSYRDRLLNRETNTNPSEQIDELLKDNFGFLVYQEDSLKFLQSICGLSGSEADNIRRAIGRKQRDRLEQALPSILEGYCQKSTKPREIAEEEAKQFLQIIEDSSNYQFGYNHSTGYSMIGYTCGYLRYYYPLEFITAFLNNSDKEEDTCRATELACQKGFVILPPKFRYSKGQYFFDKENGSIYKGIGSIKGLGVKDGDYLYSIRNNQYTTFLDLYEDIKPHINTGKVATLIKLDYFSEFGKSDYLLKQIDIYNTFYDKSTVKKENLTKLGLTHELVVANCEKETAKQYSGVNMRAIINYLVDKLPNIDIEPNDRIKHELEVLGYIQYINPNIYNQMYLSEVKLNKYGTPFFTMYNINNGKTATLKVNKKYFIDNSVETGDIIAIVNIENKPQRRKDENGAWQVVGTEKVLESYRKL
jgi:DNA polymerase-3 subunit alpha